MKSVPVQPVVVPTTKSYNTWRIVFTIIGVIIGLSLFPVGPIIGGFVGYYVGKKIDEDNFYNDLIIYFSKNDMLDCSLWKANWRTMIQKGLASGRIRNLKVVGNTIVKVKKDAPVAAYGYLPQVPVNRPAVQPRAPINRPASARPVVPTRTQPVTPSRPTLSRRTVSQPVTSRTSSQPIDINQANKVVGRTSDLPLCPNCGETVFKDANYCPYCNYKLEKCPICFLVIGKNDDTMNCKHCNTKFHAAELVEWVKLNDKCPVCNEPLTLKDVGAYR